MAGAGSAVTSYVLQLKTIWRSPLFLLASIGQPFVLLAVAVFMIRSGPSGPTSDLVLGIGLVGVLSSMLFASANAIQREREYGTLEVVVAAPTSLFWPLLGAAAAGASVGIYSILSCMLWGATLFGIDVEVARPLAFLAAIVATFFALAAFGLFIATAFVLYRSVNALASLLEIPLWLVSGLIVPLALLPAWVTPVGKAFPLYWGAAAMREAASGAEMLPELLATIALGGVFLVCATVSLTRFLNLARRDAALTLR